MWRRGQGDSVRANRMRESISIRLHQFTCKMRLRYRIDGVVALLITRQKWHRYCVYVSWGHLYAAESQR